ncbi:methyltransferase domain-containing protein [Colletotrichum melonis]|uniref:Methyltransferase domain-containing protein n=1 Tax=Colletotrichum melonis TaxID=1209925 RepID=A0AAI9XKW8_9PEZI|nr:methyltransferase domain-containing protein [Colletotrichum melonis]
MICKRSAIYADTNSLSPLQNVNDNSSVSHQSLASSTTSVASSILEYRIENGRTYHKYKDGKYNLPNDGREIDRLGKALPQNNTSSVPPNVQFQVEDIEEDWHFSLPFDYIHSRMMTGSIADWKIYLRRCFDNLNPGGYLELNDIDAIPLSDDGTLTEECTLKKSFSLWSEAIATLGSPFEKFNRLEGVLAEVGFEDVRVERFKWPTNSWPKDPKFRELGIWNHENIAPHLEGMFMAGITCGLKWTKQEVHELAVKARKDFDDTSIHAYFQIWSIFGKKPVKA